MHCHQSLFKKGKNVFYDANDKYHLSAEGKNYIAGILKHAPEFACVTNQWVNSYKRRCPATRPRVRGLGPPQPLGPGARAHVQARKEAATRNGAALPRPGRQPLPGLRGHAGLGPGHGKRLQAARAGGGRHLPHDEKTQKKHKITSLPGSLFEAAQIMKKVRPGQGDPGEHIFTKLYRTNGRVDRYRIQVSEYELQNYCPSCSSVPSFLLHEKGPFRAFSLTRRGAEQGRLSSGRNGRGSRPGAGGRPKGRWPPAGPRSRPGPRAGRGRRPPGPGAGR